MVSAFFMFFLVLSPGILKRSGTGTKKRQTKDELLKGVFCKNCNHLPIMRVHGTWFCPKCLNKDKYAHLKALNDYFLLIGLMITNRELRDFLIIDSPTTAARILQSMKLSYTGTNKQRIYNLFYTEEN